MGDYRILVEFAVKPGAAARFLELVLANAAASLRDEPGCRRFDVFTGAGDDGRVVLYEIYRDAAAFAEHCRAPHFLAFDEAVRNIVDHKRVTELRLRSPDVDS
jgi:autoinducer 2-degrading protein